MESDHTYDAIKADFFRDHSYATLRENNDNSGDHSYATLREKQ